MDDAILKISISIRHVTLKSYINLMLYSDKRTYPLIVPVLSGSHLLKVWF